jgi:hypothetical protein
MKKVFKRSTSTSGFYHSFIHFSFALMGVDVDVDDDDDDENAVAFLHLILSKASNRKL